MHKKSRKKSFMNLQSIIVRKSKNMDLKRKKVFSYIEKVATIFFGKKKRVALL